MKICFPLFNMGCNDLLYSPVSDKNEASVSTHAEQRKKITDFQIFTFVTSLTLNLRNPTKKNVLPTYT